MMVARPRPGPDEVTVEAPLAATLRAIDGALPFNRVLLDPASDLLTLADLIADDGAGLQVQLDNTMAYLGTDDRDIAVALGAMSFPWLVAGVAAGAFLADHRVPDLTPAAVSYTFAEYGYPRDIILRNPGFSALPDDPAASRPEATVVADIDELRAVLQRQLGGHLAGVLQTLRSRGARVGMRTIRQTVLEACLSALCTAEARLGRLPHLRDDVEAIFRTGDADNPLHMRTLPLIREYPTGSGGRAASVATSTCCLRFRIPGRGTCPACPHQDLEERERRMAEAALLFG